MSKLKAIITTLVLGTSSIAMAQPSDFNRSSPRFDGRFDDRVDGRVDGRFDDRVDGRFDGRVDGRFDRDRFDRDRMDGPRRYRTSWVSLAEPMQLTRGRDTIDVNLRGTFTQLRLQTVAGASYIDRVIVRFADGSRQVVEVGRMVDPHNRMLQFLLDGNNRRIDRVVVLGRSQRSAAIQVFGI